VKASPKPRSQCPLGRTLDIFGDKWSLLVVRDLMFKGKRRYRELLESDEGIATNILAQRLKMLVERGIVTKTRDEEDRKSYIYRLTERGRDLAPVLVEMIVWSGLHDPDTVVSDEYLFRATRKRSSLITGMKRAAQED